MSLVTWSKHPHQQFENTTDYEYQRHGTATLCVFCEPQAGWRPMAVTERRTMPDFAKQMKWLVDEQ